VKGPLFHYLRIEPHIPTVVSCIRPLFLRSAKASYFSVVHRVRTTGARPILLDVRDKPNKFMERNTVE
jgi:hypothetical protein